MTGTSEVAEDAEPADEAAGLRAQSLLNQFGIPAVDLTVDTSQVLGEGAFGAVYAGVHRGTDVAVKIFASADDEEVEAWKQEVRIMALLRHRNVLSLLGAAIQDGRLALISELCAQGTLQQLVQATADRTVWGQALDWIRSQRVTWGAKLDWLAQVAEGMEFLHGNGVQHRDLKAANVLVAGDEMKICDFGLAVLRVDAGQRLYTRAASSLSATVGSASTRTLAEALRTGFTPPAMPDRGGAGDAPNILHPAGTFAYIAPQLWAGEAFSDKDDVYAFGVMAVFVVSARVPFAQLVEEEHDHDVARAVQDGNARPRVPLRVGGREVPAALRAAAAACCAHPRAARPTFRAAAAQLRGELARGAYADEPAPSPRSCVWAGGGEEEPVEECDVLFM